MHPRCHEMPVALQKPELMISEAKMFLSSTGRWWRGLHTSSKSAVALWPAALQQCGSRELTASKRDAVPTSNDVFWVSGRASFLNLRAITSKIVLEEKFKQNKMGMMAENHSEILSEEPECWPEAAVQSLNDCKTHQTSLDWQHIPLPPPAETSAALLKRCPSGSLSAF